ncbi:hypothetical protein [Winogradskyella sp.]|uniref:hypothetical protein n=1 Tax=Winogradskyella sp. TaxID=1883156 RepID=UPI003F6B2978
MKKLLLLFAFASISCIATSQTIIELKTEQSMCITGKGPGQDGAINPYINKDSFAIVENLGQNEVQVRIQQNGEIIKQIVVKPKVTINVTFLKGYELYFDSELPTKVKINFKEKLE